MRNKKWFKITPNKGGAHLKKQKCNPLSPILIVLIACLVSIMLWADVGYTEKPKPLWTPKDVVTRPFVYMADVCSDGQYSLLMVLKFSLEDKQLTQQCLLVYNKTLKKEVIDTLEHGCRNPQFIGEGKKFSYFLKDENNDFILLVRDRV